MKLTQKSLKKLCFYSEEFGLLVYQKTGKTVGLKPLSCPPVYAKHVVIEGRKYRISKLVWFYHYGTYPENLYFLDGDSLNNKIGNLIDKRPISLVARKVRYTIWIDPGHLEYLRGTGNITQTLHKFIKDGIEHGKNRLFD